MKSPEARIKAIKNAKQKAKEYAGALEQSVGKAIAISENSYVSRPPMPMYKTMAMEASMDGGSRETLAVGEMEVTATVNVIFELQ